MSWECFCLITLTQFAGCLDPRGGSSEVVIAAVRDRNMLNKLQVDRYQWGTA